MKKEPESFFDHHFLFTCQLVPSPGIPLIQAQDGKTSLSVMNQANKWSKIPKYDSFAQEAVESRFSLDNNWGNWPINSNLTSSALFPDNSDDKFQNWQIEPPTTEETLSINKSLITSATSTNISIESNENQNILMNVLEGMKFWPGLFPIFLNKTIPEITANILTTTAIDANVQMNSTPEWFVSIDFIQT
uniref:Uncharacterized protein n=1 Tax=Loa loa TaxID=7209 RepID=A0A1I7V984_LOALO